MAFSNLSNALLACASGDIPIAQFDEWFEDASWNVHRTGDQALIDAVFEVEGIFSESQFGIQDEQALRNAMGSLGKEYEKPTNG